MEIMREVWVGNKDLGVVIMKSKEKDEEIWGGVWS